MKAFTKNKIRFFEFPQVLISLDPFEVSKKYFRRHIQIKCPIILDMIPDLDSVMEEYEKPQTVKIQYLQYVTGDVSTHNSTSALDIMEERLVIRPCKISTVARILLTELGTLPDFVLSADFCLALLLSKNQVGSFQVNFKDHTAIYDEVYDQSIQSTTPLIMETDPI